MRYPPEPVYYDYGESVVYQDDSVYVQGEPTVSAAEYSKQATALADAGQMAKVTKEEEWLPLFFAGPKWKRSARSA